MPADYTKEGGEKRKDFFNSTKYFFIKNRYVFLGISTFTILAFLVGGLVYQRYLIKKASKKNEVRSVLINRKDKLQELLTQSISATKTLSFFVQQDGTVKDFDLIASQILTANPDIDALELVPDGVIRYVYPLKGNEAVLGYDILHDPSRNKEALKAIRQKGIFFAGPFDLKQGGLAVVGRLPVFRQNKFWGFSAVIVKISTLLKAAGIDTLGRSGYFFQLSKINPDTHLEEFFIPQAKGTDIANFTSVDVPIGEWKLSAAPVDKIAAYTDIIWLAILDILFSMMCGVFVCIVAKRPEKLNNLVKIRTAELEESEERYRSLIEQASDGIIVYSFDGTIHQFNKSAYLESGYTKEEFAKLNLKDLLVEKKMTMRQSKADNIQSGKTAIIERKFYKKDGSLMDIEINVSMLSDTTLLAFVRNITDRKNAERALQESERKFSGVFQSSLLGFAICNSQKRLIDVNECFASMLDTSYEDLVGKNSELSSLLNCVNIKNRVAILESIAQLVRANGLLKNHEIEIEMLDGKSIFLLVSVEPLELNNQHNWLTTAIDITEKKNVELSLAQSEIKYRSLIEQASDGIVISDLSGIIMEVNKSISKMSGFNINEMVGMHIDNFLPKEDITGQPLRIEDLIEGKTLLYERRLLKKDGTAIDVEINSKMTIGNTLIGFIRDITERKKAEAELKKSNERFELIAKATNDAIWDHDFSKNETVGNDNLYDLYGFARGKVKIDFGLFESRLHPDERVSVVKNMQNATIGNAASISEEFRFKTADGSYRYFYDRAFIKYNDNGEPARMLGVMQDITGRIKDGQKLLKEKELSDSIINSLPAVFYLYNKEGKFLRWNNNFEMVTGYTGEEISKLHPLDLFDDEEKSLLDEKIKNVFIAGHDAVEANLLLKNKQKIPYYFSGMKIDYEGEICLMGFGLDFSDKLLSDKLIKESEQKFRSLVEQASDGVAILTEQGNPLYISPSVKRILGYTESEIMQLNAFELTHPDDISGVEKVLKQVMKNPGLPIKGHVSRILNKDDEWRWIDETYTNMLQVPGINGIVKNFRDITEKLQIEKKIISEKELSDSIINSLPGIFYLYDHKGRYIRWNKNFETVTGYHAEEIKEMQPLDFYDDDQKPVVAERIRKVLQRKMRAIELILLTKTREKIPFYYNSTAIDYEGFRCIMEMGFDVTERKKIENKLLVSNQHLAQKATELKTSYAELERFAYIVSHDLQEPLRMVSSFLKLLQQKYKSQLDETGEKYIYFAVDGADRMKQLIMDLLEYSRTGTNKEIPSDTNMDEVSMEVLNILENSIREQEAVIEIGSLPVLPGSSKIQLFQLMQNLLSNALKYHSEKRPVIKINAKEENDQWIFSVQDNGIGIAPKFFEKIFVIFQRLHTKNEFSGSGIGLSICKKIVEKHGGKIWVESSLGMGSTFYFTIPKK
ncbi:MAG: PAS domain S-box protein [Ferruginibacter sp.]|nr:PAS domain S-box protein [Ferruginibacter sp.]